MTRKNSTPSTVGGLAEALTLLNRTIEPQNDMQAEQQAIERKHEQIKPSQNGLLRVHLLPFEASALLALQFKKAAKPTVVKLFDRALKVPFLSSAGDHMPGSLGSQAHFAFAQFTGVSLRPNQPYEFVIEFDDNTVTQGNTVAEVIGRNNVKSLLGVCTEGQESLGQLLKTQRKKDSELRKLVNQLIELEKRYVVPYVGKVDEIIGGVVEGWVWCPAKPLSRYEVQAWCGDRLVGYGMANLWREDLERLKKDDGRLKFEIPLARHLYDGQTHTIQMKIVGQGDPDISMDFGQPLSFDAPKRINNVEHLQFLMGYSLSQKVASALAIKLKDSTQKEALIGCMHKVCFHLENREPAQARQVLEGAMVKAPKANALWSIKLAESHMLDKQFEKAAECYGDAVSAGKDFIWAHMGLGEALQQLGDKAKALKVFENAEEISPKYAPLQAKLSALRAEVLLDLKDIDAIAPERLQMMVTQGKRALVNNPDNQELSRTLIRLQNRLNGKAEEHTNPYQPSRELESLMHQRLLLEATLDLLMPTAP